MAEENKKTRHFRVPFGERAVLAICLALMGILTACLFGFAYLAESAATAAILGVTGFAPLAFSFLIGEETLAAFRLRIDIGKQVVRLRLPRRRGHVRLPAIEATVPLAAISAIETRAEAFVQLALRRIVWVLLHDFRAPAACR